MAFRLAIGKPVGGAVSRCADQQIERAVARLDAAVSATSPAFDEHVHDVRKACKKLRALARLVRPAIGDEYAVTNGLVRDAARQLSVLRDDHAIVAVVDLLAASAPQDSERGTGAEQLDGHLHAVRAGLTAQAVTPSPAARAAALAGARALLLDAACSVDRWEVPDSFGPLGGGLRRTYRDGRRAFAAARREPSAEHLHEWRKQVKYLWYQVRLLERAAESVLTPLADRLGELGELLGTHHDVELLTARLRADPAAYGGAAGVEQVIAVAQRHQEDTCERALRLGARLYAESSRAFATRVGAYWQAGKELGRERAVRLDDGGETDADTATASTAAHPPTVERERKYLLAWRPALPAHGDEIRQGYLTVDPAVRVRETNGRGWVLTVKAGVGAVRTEVELPLDEAGFGALWPLTEGRRIEKTRYRIAVDTHTAELDVFAGALAGLELVEVEFADDEAMAAFRPPDWFGVDVTDDERYANATLAVAGVPRHQESDASITPRSWPG